MLQIKIVIPQVHLGELIVSISHRKRFQFKIANKTEVVVHV